VNFHGKKQGSVQSASPRIRFYNEKNKGQMKTKERSIRLSSSSITQEKRN